MKKKKGTGLLLILSLCTALLCSCGAKEQPQKETADALQEYTVEGLGVFHLPEGFEVNSGREEEPLPMAWAEFTKGEITIAASRFGTEAYEAAGIPLPENLEEYSQRDGVQQGLPDGVQFGENEYGEWYVSYTDEDGTVIYNVLKQGTDSFGAIVAYYPEGTEGTEDLALWISQCTLE